GGRGPGAAADGDPGDPSGLLSGVPPSRSLVPQPDGYGDTPGECGGTGDSPEAGGGFIPGKGDAPSPGCGAGSRQPGDDPADGGGGGGDGRLARTGNGGSLQQQNRPGGDGLPLPHADSTGGPLSCHPGSPPTRLYSGRDPSPDEDASFSIGVSFPDRLSARQ